MKRLSWDEIKLQFDQEWIELTNYEWEEGKPYPSAGVVRVHAPSRKEFYHLAGECPPEDGAILFVGRPNREKSIIANHSMQVVK